MFAFVPTSSESFKLPVIEAYAENRAVGFGVFRQKGENDERREQGDKNA